MTSAAAVSTHAAAEHPVRATLLLGALGVVFGDIGTSPIYAFRESLRAAGDLQSEATIYGVLSLVFWAVVLIVALKYVVLVMRADNQGEGGTMALLSLALPVCGRMQGVVLVIGLAGAALFFGDAMITPAISVLSAVEGMALVTPAVTPYVVPIAAAILVILFAIQSHGSGKVGKLFGPVMAAWFALLAVMGLLQVIEHPGVLVALNPRYAIGYLTHANGWIAFTVLGSAFLALTGGEALYADMVISDAPRFASTGSWSSCRRWYSTILDRGHWSWPTRRLLRTRSSFFSADGYSRRQSCSAPRQP